MAPSEIPDVFRQDHWYVLKSDFTILAVTHSEKKPLNNDLPPEPDKPAARCPEQDPERSRPAVRWPRRYCLPRRAQPAGPEPGPCFAVLRPACLPWSTELARHPARSCCFRPGRVSWTCRVSGGRRATSRKLPGNLAYFHPACSDTGHGNIQRPAHDPHRRLLYLLHARRPQRH